MPKLTAAITVKFSEAEAERLRTRAEVEGLPLGTYIRRRVIESKEVPGEIALAQAEIARLTLFVRQMWEALASGQLTEERVAGTAARINAMDARVFVAGGK